MVKINFILAFILFVCGVSFAQEHINGKIYGDKAIAKFIKVSNTTKQITIFSDENGNFSLKASEGDSIVFSSTFYETKQIVIEAYHFSEVFVVQLKNQVNELDEVILKTDISQKTFNPKTYTKDLKSFISNDIKNRPWEYKPQPKSAYGVNLGGFVYLAELLFPKKEKRNKKKNKNQSVLFPISYYDLKTLNSNEAFFNDAFITKDLKIPLDFKYIFFEYFEEQKISQELLSVEKRLLLIDKLFELSKQFLSIISQAAKPDNKTSTN